MVRVIMMTLAVDGIAVVLAVRLELPPCAGFVHAVVDFTVCYFLGENFDKSVFIT
jgi:hypothetical protein